MKMISSPDTSARFLFFFSFLINTDESTPITRHSYRAAPQIYATLFRQIEL